MKTSSNSPTNCRRRSRRSTSTTTVLPPTAGTPILRPEGTAEPVDPPRQRAAAEVVSMVEACRADPAEFIRNCLTDPQGKLLVLARVHRELQAFLSANPRALIELPRDHGKTVQVCGRIIWELGRNPGLRVKLVCATEGVAHERGRFIRDQIHTNGRVRQVFPHLLADSPWAARAFTVQRPADVVGPSVSAIGVGTGSTGSRADLLVCDDIVDVRSLHSEAERRRVADYFRNNLMNLLEPHGRFWGLCTPWHPRDVNAELKRNTRYAVFRRPVQPDLTPVWETKWPREKLAERRAEIGDAGFARGYLLTPVSEKDLVIRPEWVRFWGTEAKQYERVVLAIDPAVSEKERADRTAAVVVGSPLPSGRGVGGEGVSLAASLPEVLPLHPGPLPTGRGSEVHILHAHARRVRPSELVAWVADLDREWRPDVILFESNGAFAAVLEMLQKEPGFGPKVVGRTSTASKRSRMEALSVRMQSGTVRLRGTDGMADPSQQDLWAELTSYPFGDHDDLADAAALGSAELLARPEPRAWI
jgi:phage terminase large subunit-like protein